MVDAKKMLEEYRSLAGLDDAKSEARKAEILEWLKDNQTDEVKAEAAQMADAALDAIEADLKNIRSQIEGVYDILPLAYIAKNYFGKSRAWLYQRINGNKIRGKQYTLNPEQKATFNAAVKDIAKRIGSVCIA